jgi:hypothetical protein
VRLLATFALAVATFSLYHHVLAATVLHEPSIGGGVSGNALGFMDWLIVWLLLYAVGAQSWRPHRRGTQPPATIAEQSPVTADQGGRL